MSGEDVLDSLTIAQLKEEEKLVSSHKVCTIHTEHLDIQNLRDDLLKVKLENEFYDANLLAILFCLFDTVTHIPANDKQAYAEVTDYLKSLFTGLRRIGAESENGNAFMVGIKTTKDVVIAKSPKSKLNDELFHEYFVGVMALNKLRRQTPNFAYILGAFKCLPPKIAPDKKVTEWCEASGINDPTRMVNYVLYEKVSSKSVEDLVGTCTADEFFSWFVQISISLHLSRHSQFTHYDLHSGNVMIRPWSDSKSFVIPYEVQPNMKWYVKADGVVQIIDYGMSHIVIGGRHFGKRNIEHAGVHSDQYRPMFDLYKFLGFSLLQMLDTKNPEGLKLIPLWALLNRELLDKDIDTNPKQLIKDMIEEVDTYFALSPTSLPIEANYTAWHWIQAMINDPVVSHMWKKNVTKDERNMTLLSCGDTCPVPAQIEEELSGQAFENVQESLNTVKFSQSNRDRSMAMSALPSQIVEMRKEMSAFQAELMGDMRRCNDMGFNATPNSVDTSQFQNFVANYVEPFLSVKTKLQHFENMKETLCDYYGLKNKNCSTNEFDLNHDQTYEQWVSNTRLLTSKLDRFIVTSKSTHMRDHILTMF
jgi:hypothetical protein